MKCPACGYANPPEVRSCLKCGKQLVPPVPKEPAPAAPPKKINPVLIIVLCLAGLFAGILGINVFASLVFTNNANAVITADSEYVDDVPAVPEVPAFDALVYPMFSSDEDEKYFHQFVSQQSRTLRLPDSEITMTLPEMTDFHFSYDDSARLLMMDFQTPDGCQVTISSSLMDTRPYTRSEAVEFEKSGLYKDIQGSETQYYYQIDASKNKDSSGSASNDPAASAVIIDCNNSRSTNILIYPGEEGEASAQALLEDMLESTGLQNLK